MVSPWASNNNVLLLNQLTGLALMYYLPNEFLITWPPGRCGDPDSMGGSYESENGSSGMISVLIVEQYTGCDVLHPPARLPLHMLS